MINDKRQRTFDLRPSTLNLRKMKRHLLIITLALLSASCRSTKEVSHRADTVYIAQRQYDSVMIDRQTAIVMSHDTVFIDRLKTEYRYRLRTDTLHHYHTDTISTYITTPPAQPEKPPPKYIFPLLCLLLCFCFVLKYKKG